MKTLRGVFDQPEHAAAVVRQRARLPINSTSVSVTPYWSSADDGAVSSALLVTVRDVPRDAESLISTIMESAGMREVGSRPPAPGAALDRRSAAAILAEAALGGAAGALAGGVLGSLVAGPGGGLAGLAIGGAAGAGGAVRATAPPTPSSGPAGAGAVGALAGIALGVGGGPGGVVIGGLVGAAVGAAGGEVIEGVLVQPTSLPDTPN